MGCQDAQARQCLNPDICLVILNAAMNSYDILITSLALALRPQFLRIT